MKKIGRFVRQWMVLFVVCCVYSPVSQAVLKIDITEGLEGALPIAVVPFKWDSPMPEDRDVSAIITSDLARSGKFSPQAEKDLIARPVKPEDVHFKSWRLAGVDHLVIGNVTAWVGGTYQVQFRLFDTLQEKQVLGYRFSATVDTLRSIAHQISDYIFTELTGLPGAFNTRLAYVTVQRTATTVVSRLRVSDTDGYNPQTLLKSDQPILSPSWSPDGSQLAYVSFEKGQAEIFTHDIHTGIRKSRAAFDGLNGAPAWSPDGKKLALTLSKDGNPEIYVLSLHDNRLQRVTRHWAIDTEAAWLPDSQTLVFTSSRSGKPQVYRKTLGSGLPPERLTFDGDYNASPAVSADGRKLAYVTGSGEQYRIALLELETGEVTVVTSGPLDESPEFAPNNSMVIYAAKHGGQSILQAVSTDGRHRQRLAFSEGEVREPAWAAQRN